MLGYGEELPVGKTLSNFCGYLDSQATWAIQTEEWLGKPACCAQRKQSDCREER